MDGICSTGKKEWFGVPYTSRNRIAGVWANKENRKNYYPNSQQHQQHQYFERLECYSIGETRDECGGGG